MRRKLRLILYGGFNSLAERHMIKKRVLCPFRSLYLYFHPNYIEGTFEFVKEIVKIILVGILHKSNS
jgi:hypothetical protein